jgi:transcriptional regulator with XRE-family HTH domain
MTQAITVREAREQRRQPLTQEQLAERSGVDQTYISLIERCKRVPSDDIKRRLAKALGIAPSRLRFAEPQPAATVDRLSDSAGHGLEKASA